MWFILPTRDVINTSYSTLLSVIKWDIARVTCILSVYNRKFFLWPGIKDFLFWARAWPGFLYSVLFLFNFDENCFRNEILFYKILSLTTYSFSDNQGKKRSF